MKKHVLLLAVAFASAGCGHKVSDGQAKTDKDKEDTVATLEAFSEQIVALKKSSGMITYGNKEMPADEYAKSLRDETKVELKKFKDEELDSLVNKDQFEALAQRVSALEAGNEPKKSTFTNQGPQAPLQPEAVGSVGMFRLTPMEALKRLLELKQQLRDAKDAYIHMRRWYMSATRCSIEHWNAQYDEDLKLRMGQVWQSILSKEIELDNLISVASEGNELIMLPSVWKAEKVGKNGIRLSLPLN